MQTLLHVDSERNQQPALSKYHLQFKAADTVDAGMMEFGKFTCLASPILSWKVSGSAAFRTPQTA